MTAAAKWAPPTTKTAREAGGDSDDRRTPIELFREIERRWGWGGFTIDGAASAANRLCDWWIGPDSIVSSDFLSWPTGRIHAERVFLNPPWGNIGPFLDRSIEIVHGCPLVERVVMLVPARTTMPWFGLAERWGRIHTIEGRVAYGGGANKKQPFEHSVVVVFERRLVAGDFR